MLDHRYETFLVLCRIKNYTKTAELLNMTQPGVTQHIHHLEQICGGKLFQYRNRTLTLTARGEKLLDFVSRLKADSIQSMNTLRSDRLLPPLCFGATLTIGEYVMPSFLRQIHDELSEIMLTMQVGNTATLLDKLQRGEIQFALVEGFFDRSIYDSKRLKTEEFIAVCAPNSPLALGEVSLGQLLSSRLILREQGSGTRDILEHALMRHNLAVGSFKGVMEIGNMSAIKQLVADNLGISFMYRVAAASEIREGRLCEIHLSDCSVQHDFSFVTLKNSIHQEQYLSWFDRFQSVPG